MDNDDSLIPKSNRGRPRGDAKRQVVQRLLEAAELLLQEKSHFDLTEREIAAAAGANEAMIHYYFGDKDGLLFEIIVRLCDEVMGKLKALDTIDPASQPVTRQIFKIMIDAYYAKPWLSRIASLEIARSGSTIRDLFLKRYGPQGLGLVYLRRLLVRLVESGVYDCRISVEYAVTSMYSVITAPLMLAPILSGDLGIVLDDFKKDGWIDHLTDLFDRQLLATGAKDAIPSPSTVSETNS